jgi:DNA-directed RNA polymerase subunit omega
VRLLPVETLEKLYGSRYAVVVLTAKRAMRIREGSEPLVETESRNPLTIALLELAAGKVHPEQPPEPSPDEGEPEEEADAEAEAEGAEPEEGAG